MRVLVLSGNAHHATTVARALSPAYDVGVTSGARAEAATMRRLESRNLARRVRQALLCLLGALGFTTPSVSSQPLSGLVFSRSDGLPVSGAVVLLLLLGADMAVSDSTLTDHLGRFALRVPEPRLLVVRHPAFLLSAPIEVTERSASAGTLMIEMTPAPERSAIARSRETEARIASITGVVTDRTTGRPLDGVEVAGPELGHALVTRWDGRFRADDVAPGRNTLRFSRLGHATREYALDVKPGMAYDLEVVLDQDAIPVEGVTVTVRPRRVARVIEPVYERMRLGLGGHFLDRKALERLGPTPLAHALATLPSVRVRGSRYRPIIRIRARCSPVVFVDGQRVGTGADAAEFLAIHASDIEIVEVYPGLAGMPPEFGSDAYCAIGIWTKRGGG